MVAKAKKTAGIETIFASYLPEIRENKISHLFNFVSTKKESRKVRVHNPSDDGSYDLDCTVIEILNNDKPFIISSLLAALERRNIAVEKFVHPILYLERDKNGKISTLFDSVNDKATHESFIHIQVPKQGNLPALEKVINDTLDWIDAAVEDWKDLLDATKNATALTKETYEADFIDWLANDNFVLLGGVAFEGNNIKKRYGIARELEGNEIPSGFAIEEIGTKLPNGLTISRSVKRSVVHRRTFLEFIDIKKGNKSIRIAGIFASQVYFQRAANIPLVSQKIDGVFQLSGYKKNSFIGKSLLSVIENFPRDELFHIEEKELYRIADSVVAIQKIPQTKLFINFDSLNKIASAIVYIPRSRFSTNLRTKISNLLEQEIGGNLIDYYTQVSDNPLARFNAVLSSDKGFKRGLDIAKVEEKINAIISDWHASLRKSVEEDKLFAKYSNAFSEDYMDDFTAEEATRDITKLEQLNANNTFEVNLTSYGELSLNIYHLHEHLDLSAVLPFIENMGFNAVDSRSYKIEPSENGEIWLHNYRLSCSVEIADFEELKPVIEQSLKQIWNGVVENDSLNRLNLTASLPWERVMLLRGYAKYFQQLALKFSYEFISDTLNKNAEITRLLIDLFDERFHPELRGEGEENIRNTLEGKLSKLTDVNEDKVLRQFYETITATLRSNFYIPEIDYISFKFECAKVPNMPVPRPMFEIFVYSKEFEGVHLRGGKVARGGLRWSDRKEDFRTEVLGLVKAQIVKNSVIVPVGSKGGFVVKKPAESREDFLKQGQECYKKFLSGLLDITDNIQNNKVKTPYLVRAHDGQDPYLVVAADKGTATFSDIANNLAIESYDFWLGDAFASGGSVGYDHKKMGITAKGAWVAVQRHFYEEGIDIQTDPVTVLGIGDMGGDVFGNGMLCSESIKLVAGFNHLHIFIDPNPTDVKASFKERKRLFELPRSSWTDYDKKLISKGGGIFERSAKSIKLTKQIKGLVGTDKTEVTPDELINLLLKAKIDLLWNGGIGTYVRATTESNESVGDKANDNLRVTGKELGARVVGEGGNLGLTQLGRIEAAKVGVKLNTDAIDNSAGVDCSDHEVNIKIALEAAVKDGTLTEAKRNKLLESMTDEVGEQVLYDNLLQTQAISIAEVQAPDFVEQNARFMGFLESLEKLDRAVEYLPTNEEINLRKAQGAGLTRPEISVTLAYAKLDLYERILDSKMPDDAYFTPALIQYFPSKLQKTYKDYLTSHQLKREIISTIITNDLVNRMGVTFFYRIRENTSAKACDIARAYTIARDVFDISNIWEKIETQHKTLSKKAHVALQVSIRRFIERVTVWLVRNSGSPIKCQENFDKFAKAVQDLKKLFAKKITPNNVSIVNAKKERFTELEIPEKLAKEVAELDLLIHALDIINVADKGKETLENSAQLMFKIGNEFKFAHLREQAYGLDASDNHWDNLVIKNITEKLYDIQSDIASKILASDDKEIDSWKLKNKARYNVYKGFMDSIDENDSYNHSMLTIALSRAEGLLK